MAKARKPTAFSTAERFLGFHSRPGSATVAPFPDDDLPDLVESDIWYSQSSDAPTTPTADRELETTDRSEAPRRVGGLSRAFADGRQVAASAPVEVPAWPSRFAELEKPEPTAPCEEDADGWVPPHLYLARRQARASVVEGVGRTLKGRDASRVRDAVWSRTGFPG
uniref:Uncharacterized protein n=1 Tax=Avena sativa TaxID=4498 RepID=A0ACD5U8I0_AVESA